MAILLAMTEWDVKPWIERLEQQMPEEKFYTSDLYFPVEEIMYAVVWKHPSGILKNLPNVKAIFSLGAGVDNILQDTNLPDCPIVRAVDPDLTNRISEYIVLHCLRYLRQTKHYENLQRQILWQDDPNQPAARDVRVGVMGLGKLGADASSKLAMMGFQVAGWSRSQKSIKNIETYYGEDGLKEFLARTDILVSLLPLTNETTGILSMNLFQQLAQDGFLGGAALINAGRGALQDEDDIIKALDSKILIGATLDVFNTEPLPKSSLLWKHPRVTITPHNAALTSPDVVVKHIAHQIERVGTGMNFEHIINPDHGY